MKYHFYSNLAQYYDKFYCYVAYESQADFFLKLLNRYKVKNQKLLDLACGTGKHAALMTKRGCEVIGVDLSPEMVDVANKLYPQIRFHQGDMKTWKNGEKFGAITILFNSILYNKNRQELIQTLTNCHDQLIDGGLLIFDTVDKKVGVDSKKKVIKNGNVSFAPKWIYRENVNKLDLEIDFVVNGKKYHDHHEMGAFSLDEQKQLAIDAGFKVAVIKVNFPSSTVKGLIIKRTYLVCQKI